ncbi:MAG: hypothetical protein M3Y33_17760 [Actinomycetota bacterium]|nr:hypothetical protein [Actinomycetota bacterium]
MKDVLTVPWWAWAAAVGVIAVILGTELAAGICRGAREVTLREAAGTVSWTRSPPLPRSRLTGPGRRLPTVRPAGARSGPGEGRLPPASL